MIKAFLPKEEKYYDDFREMISHIQQMAKYTEQLFADELIDKNHYLNIKPLELRCDEISSRIVKRLNKTFITPFDREDIFALAKRMDDISDMLLGVAARIETFNITKKIQHADILAAIVHKQVQELVTAIQDLKEKRINEIKAVKDLESEADQVYRNAIQGLFTNEKDAIELIKKKEILDLLERTSDRCQSVANIILSIFIKNS
ncbi:MAG: DUF47 family protein [Ignavibacteriota bacterium]|jgi:uncharacterized protein Yka (UPF0111/DUF47 family)|nr:MAG: DUF47 family protein [Chlorobiota bacterium]MBE7476685.1 DUF47 family protein [Ignavibacteriales bacterium]MBL1122063.1 DUF47 family protein [Ignavibacteriota bacterium]MBV6418823.1 hypothetical protein [Ignavibacteriaceae bacterium]MCE7856083.1 DUF47 family protein [Ignavibacteria bacterium CHB3]MEB2297739.1 DUF47 family protein [Ignavibacteria bacterium]